MSRIAYVNGQYVPGAKAAVSIDDRAFTFGDGVYEVCEVNGGALIEEARHLARLRRSLAALRIPWPVGERALRIVMREIVRRNRVHDGLVYLQISRGAARRDHGFPPEGTKPGLVVSARPLDPAVGAARAATGVSVLTLPDQRWARPDIKTLQLLPNVLAKQSARDAGAFEAWFVDRAGFVTEGASTNAWIVTADGALVTRQADEAILNGVTRSALDRDRRQAGPSPRGATVHAARGARRARGVFLQRHHDRHACRFDRWQGRSVKVGRERSFLSFDRRFASLRNGRVESI